MKGLRAKLSLALHIQVGRPRDRWESGHLFGLVQNVGAVSDVLLVRREQGLVVPNSVIANGQGGCDEAATSLALEHLLAQSLDVPSKSDLVVEGIDQLNDRFVGCNVQLSRSDATR